MPSMLRRVTDPAVDCVQQRSTLGLVLVPPGSYTESNGEHLSSEAKIGMNKRQGVPRTVSKNLQ